MASGALMRAPISWVAVEQAPTLSVAASLGDLIAGYGDVMDSMATVADGAKRAALLGRSREIAVCGHALFVVAYSVVSVIAS